MSVSRFMGGISLVLRARGQGARDMEHGPWERDLGSVAVTVCTPSVAERKHCASWRAHVLAE